MQLAFSTCKQAKGGNADRTYFDVSKFLLITKTENKVNDQSLLGSIAPSVSTGTFTLLNCHILKPSHAHRACINNQGENIIPIRQM